MAATGYTPISLYYSTTATTAPTAGNLVNGELAINITDGKLYYKNNSGVVTLLASAAIAGLTLPLSATNGGTGQSTYATGDILYASATNTLSKLPASTNGYVLSLASGVPAWTPAPPSGATISNDTSTATNLYPLFSSATSGSPSTIYTSNAKYLYKPSTGELQASELVASNGLVVNSTTVNDSYTVATGTNAFSVGPITTASGATVTVASGQRWVII
jgi:hypothetical protein